MPLAARVPRLVQAHGWAQLQGWIGLFVAGMGLRLMPRMTGRRPLPGPLAISVLVLLASGVVLRVLGQAVLDGTAATVVLAAAGVASGLGAAALTGGLAAALLGRGRPWQAWRLAAWAGTGWWLVWAGLTAAGGLTSTGGLVPERTDMALVWLALLGPLSNFVWAVQARSVPVFYGRRQPDAVRLGPPLLVLNLGVALLAASPLAPSPVMAVGLGLAGAGTCWLAPVAGSVRGRAHRLRPPSRAAARYIVAANLWAALSGAMLVAAAAAGLAGHSAEALEDAALHAAGLGFMTTLIVGMAQLLMPAFAGERIELPKPGPELWLTWPVLMLATALRVGAALLDDQPAAVAVSGALTWIGLAAFAAGLVRVMRKRSAAAPPAGPRPVIPLSSRTPPGRPSPPGA